MNESWFSVLGAASSVRLVAGSLAVGEAAEIHRSSRETNITFVLKDRMN